MIKGFSLKELEYIQNVISGNANKYSPSYAARLRKRILSKAVPMLKEVLLVPKMHIKEYNRMHRFNFNNQNIDEFYLLLQELRNAQWYPWEKKEEDDKNNNDNSISKSHR